MCVCVCVYSWMVGWPVEVRIHGRAVNVTPGM